MAGSEGVALGQFHRLDPIAERALIWDTIGKAGAALTAAEARLHDYESGDALCALERRNAGARGEP